MLQEKITIVNKLGLHARAAAKFVSCANHFASHIEIIRNNHKANGKSIMGVMMLAASKGTEVELLIEGEDEHDAMSDLKALINNKFGEDE